MLILYCDLILILYVYNLELIFIKALMEYKAPDINNIVTTLCSC